VDRNALKAKNRAKLPPKLQIELTSWGFQAMGSGTERFDALLSARCGGKVSSTGVYGVTTEHTQPGNRKFLSRVGRIS